MSNLEKSFSEGEGNMPERSIIEEKQEKIEDTIVAINILRHGKKEKGDDDRMVRLTPEGKVLALCQALRTRETEGALTRGSFRVRSQETAGIFALKNEILTELNITGEDLTALEEKLVNKKQLSSEEQQLVKKVAEKTSLEELEKKYGAKFDANNFKWIEADSRLDFEAQGLVEKNQNQAYVDGHLLEYTAKKSDEEALESNDRVSSTYTRIAGAVSDLILSYVATGKELHNTVQNMVRLRPESFKSIVKDGKCAFERFFGTHAGIGESFMLKIIEVLEKRGQLPKGTQEEIMEKTGASFKENEGIRLEIHNSDKGQSLRLILPDRIAGGLPEINFTSDVLSEIIADCKAFQKQIEEKIKNEGNKNMEGQSNL